MADHGNVSASRHGLHEGLGARLGNGPKVIDQFVFRHPDAGVLDGDRAVRLVRDDLDEEVRLRLDLLRVLKSFWNKYSKFRN